MCRRDVTCPQEWYHLECWSYHLLLAGVRSEEQRQVDQLGIRLAGVNKYGGSGWYARLGFELSH